MAVDSSDPLRPSNPVVREALLVLLRELNRVEGKQRQVILSEVQLFVTEMKNESPKPVSSPIQSEPTENVDGQTDGVTSTIRSLDESSETPGARPRSEPRNDSGERHGRETARRVTGGSTTPRRSKRKRQLSPPPVESLREATPPPSGTIEDESPNEPPHKVRRRRRHEELIALTPDCSLQDIEEIRSDFRTELVKLKVDVLVDGGKSVTKGFSPKDIDEIDGLLFNGIMGKGSLDRLQALATDYNNGQHLSEIVDSGLGARAAKLAGDVTNIASVRKFFGLLSHKHHMHADLATSIVVINEVIEDRKVLAEYTRLGTLASEGDAETLQFLRANNHVPSKGRDWRTCMHDFLAEKLEMTKSDLSSICQRAKGINGLIDQFGEGVIPLLPPKSTGRLKRLGNQRMAVVCRLLKERVESFQPICDLVKQHVYEPIVRGDKHITFDLTTVPKSQEVTLIDGIKAAVISRITEVEE